MVYCWISITQHHVGGESYGPSTTREATARPHARRSRRLYEGNPHRAGCLGVRKDGAARLPACIAFARIRLLSRLFARPHRGPRPHAGRLTKVVGSLLPYLHRRATRSSAAKVLSVCQEAGEPVLVTKSDRGKLHQLVAHSERQWHEGLATDAAMGIGQMRKRYGL